MDKWIKNGMCVHVMECISLEKEENPTMYINLDDPWGYYAKLNKPVIEEKYCMISLKWNI